MSKESVLKNQKDNAIKILFSSVLWVLFFFWFTFNLLTGGLIYHLLYKDGFERYACAYYWFIDKINSIQLT